jgi:hypothetical protein
LLQFVAGDVLVEPAVGLCHQIEDEEKEDRELIARTIDLYPCQLLNNGCQVMVGSPPPCTARAFIPIIIVEPHNHHTHINNTFSQKIP